MPNDNVLQTSKRAAKAGKCYIHRINQLNKQANKQNLNGNVITQLNLTSAESSIGDVTTELNPELNPELNSELNPFFAEGRGRDAISNSKKERTRKKNDF